MADMTLTVGHAMSIPTRALFNGTTQTMDISWENADERRKVILIASEAFTIAPSAAGSGSSTFLRVPANVPLEIELRKGVVQSTLYIQGTTGVYLGAAVVPSGR